MDSGPGRQETLNHLVQLASQTLEFFLNLRESLSLPDHLDWDKLPIKHQWDLIQAMPLPPTAVVWTGNRSLHPIQWDLHTCFNYGLDWPLSEFSFQSRCL